MDLGKLEVPLPEDLTEELIGFWEGIFETSYDGFRGIFAAAEREHNRDTVYVARMGERLGGTCHLTVSRSNPELGGFGEVATHPEFRRVGIASAVCASAVEDFRMHGGRALFLGTGEPDAFRIYHRLGWRKLAGATVMALITSGRSPETFLVDYLRDSGSATIVDGSAADRIPMIPLIVSPHDWQVLDANVGLFSTRYVVQGSCMSLYPKYEALDVPEKGAWFSAYTSEGRLVGLATARLDKERRCQVDGFTHQNLLGVWQDLIHAAARWGAAHAAPVCWAALSLEDEHKRSLFESVGFREVGKGDEFDLDGREVASVRLERDVNDGHTTSA